MEIQNKIHIMYIVQSAGGVDKYLSMLLSHMDKKKFIQTLVCSFDYIPESYSFIADKVEQIKMYREISVFQDISSILKIRKLIKSYQPDIIYCHSSKGGALGRLAHLGLKNNTKVIYNPHGWSFNMKGSQLKKNLYIIIERILSKLTDHFITISKIEKQNAISKKICIENNVTVIYNGIDIKKNKMIKSDLNRDNLRIPSDSFIIGMVGRISEQKAPDIFVKAAILIKEKIPQAFFIIVGDGELRTEIESLILKANLKESFIITGWVSDATPYIRLFDIATLLSRWEGFGLVLAEYMAAQKPIITTKIDAIPEIVINGENGLLVDVDNPQKICEAILKIKEDKYLYEKMVKVGCEMVQAKFDITRVVKEHAQLFQSILKE